MCGDGDAVRQLVLSGADVNAMNNRGQTTPTLAAGVHGTGNKGTRCALMDYAADQNMRVDGQTLLHTAVERRDTELVRRLLDCCYTRCNARDEYGLTPLHRSLCNISYDEGPMLDRDAPDMEIFALLARHPRVDEKMMTTGDYPGLTALDMAYEHELGESFIELVANLTGGERGS